MPYIQFNKYRVKYTDAAWLGGAASIASSSTTVSVPNTSSRTFQLTVDGVAPASTKTASPIRITYFEGTMYEGKLKGLVDPKLSNHPAWRSRLMIGIYNFELNYLEQSVVGSFKDGKLDGLIQIYGKMTVDPKGHLSSYLFEGLTFLGWFEKGKPVGPCWKFLVGGTYIYGIVDKNGDFTGQDIAFIYQDLELALVGEFKDGILVRFSILFFFYPNICFKVCILKHNKQLSRISYWFLKILSYRTRDILGHF